MVDSKEQSDDKNQQIIWKQILNEVSNQSSRRLCSTKSLLVLGDNGSGKASLISKLQSAGGREEGDNARKSGSLQYTYIDLHCDEDKQRLGTWILNGDPYFTPLLEHVVTVDSVKNLTVLLCADMSKPWHVMETLEHWAHALYTHLSSLPLSAKELNDMERKVQMNFDKYYKEFESIEESISADGGADTTTTTATTTTTTTATEQNVLPNNMGIPMIVAITKTDHIAVLEKDNDYKEEHFDFIQKHIRRFCLKYGAGLVYTSSKEGSNVSLLYKYLNYQLYGAPLHVIPQLVEKTSIFVPCGWDNQSKIAIIDEHNKTFNSDDPFNEHIIKPLSTRPVHHQEREITAEDEQTFLDTQLNILNRVPTTTTTNNMQQQQQHEHRLSPRGANVSVGPRGGARLASPQTKGKLDSGKGVGGESSSETVLANFFNSLLNKTTTTGKTTTKPTTTSPTPTNGATQGDLKKP